MHLRQHAVAPPGKGAAVGWKRRGLGQREVEEIDAGVDRRGDDAGHLLYGALQARTAEADDADLFAAMRQYAIFHASLSSTER